MTKYERIYLHIGDVKTGSASLQLFFPSDLFGLLTFDLAYPGRVSPPRRLDLMPPPCARCWRQLQTHGCYSPAQPFLDISLKPRPKR